MFGSKKPPTHHTDPKSMGILTRWDVPVIFGIMLVLSVVELGFTIHLFTHFQKKHEWWSKTEKARLGFLIFSSLRTIILAAVYTGFHFAKRYLHSMFHTIYLVLSTVFWIVSGVLIHQMWGYFECGGVGKLEGGINTCHEVKIVEIIAWVLAGISIVATVPVVRSSIKRRKMMMDSHRSHKNAASG